MTGNDRRAHDRGCGDVAAYALGALDAAQADAFRPHLERCVVCRDELAAFQQVVDTLPMSAPAYRAPESLRKRMLDAVADEPRRARTTQRRRLALPRPALAFGGALSLAVAAVVVVLALGSSSSPRARVIDAKVTGPGTASLRLSKGHAELVVHRFAAPPAGEIYEVWLQRSKQSAPIPTSLFSPNSQGEADVDVPNSVRGISQVMVTPEPAGGTQKPTHPPVIQAVLD